MGYILCTAEKPSVAKDIARIVGAEKRKDGFFEGNGYLVTWAIGHLVGLAEPSAYGFVPQDQIYSEQRQQAYDELPLIPDNFKLVVLDATKNQFRVIKNLMQRDDVDFVIDCGDMGAEGHILQWFIRIKAGCKKPVKRFCATSMTDEAIRAAMDSLRPIDDFKNIIKGEYCKKKADWITGMSMSRVESLKYNAGINVGRVQSPTLYFVVKRYLEVSNFKVTNYFTMDAELSEGFHVYWTKDTDGMFPPSVKDSEGRILNRSETDRVSAEIEQGKTGLVSDIVKQKKATDRPQLYDITELQRDANKKYGYTAAVTLATAQALYETQKVLSYPRTDSRYITSDLQHYMTSKIKAIGTSSNYSNAVDTLLKDGLNIDKKIVDDAKVTDHHAILTTEKIEFFNRNKLYPSPEEKNKGVTVETLNNILDLVLCRMIVSFSQPYIYEQTTISVTFPNGFIFTASGRKNISMGWKAVQESLLGKDKSEDDVRDSNEEQLFPNISKGQQVNIKRCFSVPKKTTPPKLHTEATLLTAMENAGAYIDNGAILKGKGIGTQATRAEIIKKLFDTGVIETTIKGKTNYIQPTAKGLGIIRVLPKELYSPQITADWETKIAKIAEGKYTEDDFMIDFIAFIKDKVREVKESETNISFKKEREVFGICPWCGKDIHRYTKKNDKDKVENISFYCSDKCGFNLDTSNQTFTIYLNRSITEAEAKRFISKGSLILNINKKSGDGTYRGEFVFRERIYNSKKYCNIQCNKMNAQ